MTPHENASGGDRRDSNLADGEKELKAAQAHLKQAIHDDERAHRDIEKAEREIAEAAADIEKAEHDHHREIEVKVDGVMKKVRVGTYVVSAFKAAVGVAAARELDLVKHGELVPLDDNAEIKPHECEVFVSHVRTGGSA
jgi:multidrug resistance efflux pump